MSLTIAKRTLAFVAFAVALVLVVRYARKQAHIPHLQAPPAAGFPMQQLNGAELRLSDFQGKVILLDFWASWCAPCRDEIPHLVEWQAKYGGSGLQVIGISMDDDRAAAEKFAREFRMNYPVVAGSAALAAQFGGILGLPANIVIGRDGKIVSKHLGVVDLSALEHELTLQLEVKPTAAGIDAVHTRAALAKRPISPHSADGAQAFGYAALLIDPAPKSATVGLASLSKSP